MSILGNLFVIYYRMIKEKNTLFILCSLCFLFIVGLFWFLIINSNNNTSEFTIQSTESNSWQDDAIVFVSHVYEHALGRPADTSWRDHFVSICENAGYFAVYEWLLLSDEANKNLVSPEDFIVGLYTTILDRSASKDEIEHYLVKIKEGLSRKDLIKIFYQSEEWKTTNRFSWCKELSERIDCPLVQDWDNAEILETCIQNTLPWWTLSLPSWIFEFSRTVIVSKNITIVSKDTSKWWCTLQDKNCATLQASSDFENIIWVGGILSIRAAVNLNNIIFDGNKDKRWESSAWIACSEWSNWYWATMTVHTPHVSITWSVFKNALCATWLWVSPRLWHIRLEHNLIQNNGVHYDHWMRADGRTILDAHDSVISNNTFIDNTDIDLIFWWCQNCLIENNTILHTEDENGAAFAWFMLHAWPDNRTSGDYTWTKIRWNTVDCWPKKNCWFGLYYWSQSRYDAPAFGWILSNNTIKNAELPVNIDTATGEYTFDATNTISWTPWVSRTSCWLRSVHDLNIAHTSVQWVDVSWYASSSISRMEYTWCIPKFHDYRWSDFESEKLFIRHVYRNWLGRKADAGWLDSFDLLCKEKWAGDVYKWILLSDEAGGIHSTQESFVAAAYTTILMRTASEDEIYVYAEALENWNLTREKLIEDFIQSDEWRALEKFTWCKIHKNLNDKDACWTIWWTISEQELKKSQDCTWVCGEKVDACGEVFICTDATWCDDGNACTTSTCTDQWVCVYDEDGKLQNNFEACEWTCWTQGNIINLTFEDDILIETEDPHWMESPWNGMKFKTTIDTGTEYDIPWITEEGYEWDRALWMNIFSDANTWVKDKIEYNLRLHYGNDDHPRVDEAAPKYVWFAIKPDELLYETPKRWVLHFQAWQCCAWFQPPLAMMIEPNPDHTAPIEYFIVTRNDTHIWSKTYDNGEIIFRDTLPRGEWSEIIFRMVPSPITDDRIWQVAIRVNDELKKDWRWDRWFTPITKEESWGEIEVREDMALKIGHYRARQATRQTVYFDNIRYGTTAASVGLNKEKVCTTESLPPLTPPDICDGASYIERKHAQWLDIYGTYSKNELEKLFTWISLSEFIDLIDQVVSQAYVQENTNIRKQRLEKIICKIWQAREDIMSITSSKKIDFLLWVMEIFTIETYMWL